MVVVTGEFLFQFTFLILSKYYVGILMILFYFYPTNTYRL